MRDAIIGIIAGILVLSIAFAVSRPEAPTLQGVFEDVERYKANRMMEEQIEQAKRTIEKQEAAGEDRRKE